MCCSPWGFRLRQDWEPELNWIDRSSAQILFHPSCWLFEPYIQLSYKFASKILPGILSFWKYSLATETTFVHKRPGSLLHQSMQVHKVWKSISLSCVRSFHKVKLILQSTPWEWAETETFWKLTLIWFLSLLDLFSPLTICFLMEVFLQ